MGEEKRMGRLSERSIVGLGLYDGIIGKVHLEAPDLRSKMKQPPLEECRCAGVQVHWHSDKGALCTAVQH